MELVLVTLGRIFRGRPGFCLVAVVVCGTGYLLKDGGDLQVKLHVHPSQPSEAKKGDNLLQNVQENGERHEKSDRESMARLQPQ